MMNGIILENITVQVKLMKDAIDNKEDISANSNIVEIASNFINFFAMFESSMRSEIAKNNGNFDMQDELKELELIDLCVDEMKRMLSMGDYNVESMQRIATETKYILGNSI